MPNDPDIVERLRDLAEVVARPRSLCLEAAAEIERLRGIVSKVVADIDAHFSVAALTTDETLIGRWREWLTAAREGEK